MASDMSGWLGEEGKQAWLQASGGDEAAYNREVQAWRASQNQPAAAPAAPQQGVLPATTASPTQSQSLGGIALPAGASGYNAADPTAYRKIDPNILRNMTPEQRAEWSAQNIDDLSAHGDATRARAQWMAWQKSYDPNCPPSDPYQAEDGSGCVEKPDNSNRGYQQEQQGGGDQGGGGPAGPAAPAEAEFDPNSELQQRLMDMYSGRQGQFAGSAAGGEALTGGGIWTQESGVNPALVSATLNAFTPNAPSAQAAGGPPPAPTPPSTPSTTASSTSAVQNLTQSLGANAPAQATQGPSNFSQPAPAGSTALTGALAKRYTDPNDWWQDKPKQA